MRKTTMLILALIVLIQCSCTKEGKQALQVLKEVLT